MTDAERVSIYENAFMRTNRKCIRHAEDIPPDLRRRAVYYGVKFVNLLPYENFDTHQDADDRFELVLHVLGTVGMLTPRQLLQVFPLRKDYDGKKWQTKDYFFSIKALERHGMDEAIGDATAAMELLFDYMNSTISHFMVHVMSIMSAIRRFEGKPDLIEEFFNLTSVNPQPVKPRRPDYLRLLH